MTFRWTKRWWLALPLAVIAAVAACTEAAPTPAPTGVPEITAGQAPVAPSPTVTPALPTTPTPPLPPIATLAPSATPIATPTPSPSPTPTPTPTPTATLTPTPVPTPVRPVVTVGGAAFFVEVARTLVEQAAGLSDRDELREGMGMLFPQSRDRIPVFWMRRMRFPLDLLWIAADCTLAEVTPDVPPPEEGTSTANLPTYSPSVPVRYVLEINAGAAQADGVTPGDPVRFFGQELGGLSCSTV